MLQPESTSPVLPVCEPALPACEPALPAYEPRPTAPPAGESAPPACAPQPLAPQPTAQLPTPQSPQQILKHYFGYDSFRPYQGELVEQVLAGRDVLGVMPTGAGKSIIYQVPALVLPGTTIVISPLIALMKDQVDALRLSGVEAAFINSSQTASEREAAMAAVQTASCRLLYVAPERLGDNRFIDLCKSIEIPLVAVDEAHCVSQWGNDFRKSYKEITTFITQLETRPVLCAMTATATHEVREDIILSLGLADPYVCVSGFDRPNLYLGVLRPAPHEKTNCLVALVREHARQNGIIYCSTRSATEEVFATLASEGFAVAMYHAGMDDIARQRNQDDFVFDHKSIMVATNAFGMGIDKPNIGFVFHYNMPRDLESYYQEAGRAGRDGSPANCILIYNKKDVQTAIYFADKNHEDRHQQGMDAQLSETLYQRDLDRVRKMTAYCKTTDCLRSYVLRYFGESESPYRCEHCSSCEAESETIEATVEAQKILSCVLRLEQRDRRVGRVMIVDILRGSRAQNVLRSQFDQLSTYGIMSDVPLSFAHNVLDALIDEGYLSVSAGRYPVIGITAQGNTLIKQRGSFIIKVAKAKIQAVEPVDSPAPQQRSKTEKPAASSDANIDQSLLAKLKALRRSIASEQSLPAFIVFHDSTLIDMCLKRPTSLEEFLLVSGVGQHKADLYGEKFLACLNGE